MTTLSSAPRPHCRRSLRSARFGIVALVLSFCAGLVYAGEPIRLFDGQSLSGWEGDTKSTWRVQDGAITAGTLDTTVPRNEFITSTRRLTNFVLTVKVRLLGTEGFVNGGVQIRSERTQQPPNEMSGYQADVGEGWWGALYDESRRNKVLIRPEAGAVEKALRKGEWNTYIIRCEGRRIRTWINEIPMIDYTESDESLPQHGLIGLQVHGGGKTEIAYKDITVEILE